MLIGKSLHEFKNFLVMFYSLGNASFSSQNFTYLKNGVGKIFSPPHVGRVFGCRFSRNRQRNSVFSQGSFGAGLRGKNISNPYVAAEDIPVIPRSPVIQAVYGGAI